MDPIIPIEPEAKPRPKRSPRGSRADQLVAYLAFASALLAFCSSAYLFARFLENDDNSWGSLSAFLFCFGGGAFAYVPAWLTGKIALKSYKQGPRRKAYQLALFLVVPWFLLAFALLFFSPLAALYSLAIALITLVLIFWASYSLYKI